MNDIVFAGRHLLIRNVARHKHRTWELIYCTGASGKLVFSGMELPYGVGDVAVIPPDTPHENVSGEGLTNIHLNIDHASLAFRQPVVVGTIPTAPSFIYLPTHTSCSAASRSAGPRCCRSMATSSCGM